MIPMKAEKGFQKIPSLAAALDVDGSVAVAFVAAIAEAGSVVAVAVGGVK